MKKGLCELCNPKQWKTISSTELVPMGYPVYGANGIIGYYDKFNHEKETILITCRGATCGTLNICTPFSYVNGNAMALDDLSADIDIKYLYFYLMARGLNDVITGSAQPQIVRQSLKNVQITYPDIKEQQKIADTLDKLESLINLRKQQLAKLDDLVKARFVEMFGDPVCNPKHFLKVMFSSIMDFFPQNGLYKPQTDYVQGENGTPILRIDAFYNGKVTDFSVFKRLLCSEEEIERYLLKENDIVINRVNSIEYLGKCAHIVGLKEKTVFESNMMRFHLDEKKANPIYITRILCTQYIYRQILRRAKKSVNQASINQEDVKTLEIMLPPLLLQNEFAAFVERVDQRKQTVQQSLDKLELMKKALMQEYFG